MDGKVKGIQREEFVDRSKLQGDLTKPHLRQFFECKSIGPEPPLNKDGFWAKPDVGMKHKGKKDDR